jgi:hypothetical protein
MKARIACIALGALAILASCDSDLTAPPTPLVPGVSPNGSPDVTPPTLTALSFSATSINTTSGPASVTVYYTVTDDLSGAHEVSGGFQAPDTPQFQSSGDIAPDALSHSGSFIVTIPQYSDAGTWKLQMNIGDAAGNYRFYWPADLAAEGFPTDIEVVSDEDVTPPTLTAVSISPATVNTTTGAHVVTVSYTVTDNKAGTVDVSTGMDSPTFTTHLSGSGVPPGGSTDFSGTVDITIPQNSELGTWKLVMNIGDAVGNYEFWTATELANAGFPPDVNVIATQMIAIDINPNMLMCTDTEGDIPVAILSSATFAASTVDGISLRFGRLGTEAAAQRLKNGRMKVQMKDVNKDGFTDAVYQFLFGDTGFSCADIPTGETTADVTATLTGMAGGLPIGGTGVLRLKRK